MSSNAYSQLVIALASIAAFFVISCGGCFVGFKMLADHAKSRQVNLPKPEKKELSRKEKCERAAVGKFEKDLKKALNTKSTAKFQLFAEYHEDKGEAVSVFGEVTAQNTFGATVTESVGAFYIIIDEKILLAEYTVNGKQTVVSGELYDEALRICGVKK